MLRAIETSAIATAGPTAASGLVESPPRFSRAMPPQSAIGGCTPSPTKLRLLMNRMAKLARIAKSVASGLTTWGSISPNRIQPMPSPRDRASLM